MVTSLWVKSFRWELVMVMENIDSRSGLYGLTAVVEVFHNERKNQISSRFFDKVVKYAGDHQEQMKMKRKKRTTSVTFLLLPCWVVVARAELGVMWLPHLVFSESYERAGVLRSVQMNTRKTKFCLMRTCAKSQDKCHGKSYERKCVAVNHRILCQGWVDVIWSWWEGYKDVECKHQRKM